MISEREYLKGRDREFPISDSQRANMVDLLERVNQLRTVWGQPMIVSSGYRPAVVNASVGGAPASLHISCRAVDIRDEAGRLGEYCIKNIDLLESCGLWLEHPAHTPSWVHLQSAPPKSGKRIFIP